MGTASDNKIKFYQYLKNIANDYEEDIIQDTNVSEAIVDLVKKLSVKNKAVILIDEYDKPIIDYFSDLKKAQANREVLSVYWRKYKQAYIIKIQVPIMYIMLS